jgi:hypothetical protein
MIGPARRPESASLIYAMTALWEASDRVCGKRLKVMIPTLLLVHEQPGQLQLGQAHRDPVLAISAATIDRLLVDVKKRRAAAARRAGFLFGNPALAHVNDHGCVREPLD